MLIKVWILKQMYYESKIGHLEFGYVCKYIRGLGTSARKETLEEVEELMEKLKSGGGNYWIE